MEQCDAVVVGGGVAGAAMGVALGRFDVNAVVLERRREVGEINRGDALQIAAVRALDRIGALDAIFQAGGQKTNRMAFSHYRKGRLGLFDISEVFGPPFNYILTLAHEKIETALINESDRRGIPTRRGHTVRTFRRAGDEMVISVHGEQGDYEIRTRIVIGADGKSSTVRKHFGEEPKTYWYEQECVVVEAENSTGVPAELRMAYHPDGFLVIGPLSPTVIRVYIISLRHEAANIFKMPADEIGKLAIGRDPLLKGYRFSKRGGHIFKMGLYHCDTYVAEGCALIGDAAHITSPAGGHGMNLAINDAEELADRIGPKLASGEPISMEDLKGYEAERRQANEQALHQAHDIFMRLTGPDIRYRLVRPLFFWMVANIPVIPGRMFKQMVGLGISPSRRQS